MKSVLVWRRSIEDEDMNDVLYDVSTEDLLYGAYLDILETIYAAGVFGTSRPLEDNFLYKRLTKRKRVLEVAVGDSTSGALENLKKELHRINQDMKSMEERHQKSIERQRNIEEILNNRDGEEAQRSCQMYYGPEDIVIHEVYSYEANEEPKVAEA